MTVRPRIAKVPRGELPYRALVTIYPIMLPLESEERGLRERGKLFGTHLDADNRTFLTPPDGSVSLSEARAAWPRKIIWCDLPSSVDVAFREAAHKS